MTETLEDIAKRLFLKSAWYLGGVGWDAVDDKVRADFLTKAKAHKVSELRRAVKTAVHHVKALSDLDWIISQRIEQIERLLFDLDIGPFTSGAYSYACCDGQWRFVRTTDRRPVLDVCRDDRCAFLYELRLPPLTGAY